MLGQLRLLIDSQLIHDRFTLWGRRICWLQFPSWHCQNSTGEISMWRELATEIVWHATVKQETRAWTLKYKDLRRLLNILFYLNSISTVVSNKSQFFPKPPIRKLSRTKKTFSPIKLDKCGLIKYTTWNVIINFCLTSRHNLHNFICERNLIWTYSITFARLKKFRIENWRCER